MTEPLDAFLHGALVVERSDLATVAASGPDRASWLNALLTCDVSKFSVGQAATGLALNKKGRVLTEVFAAADSGRILIGLDRSRRDELLAHFDQYLIMEDAEIGAVTDPVSWLIAYGPAVPELVRTRASDALFAAPLPHFGHPAAVFAVGDKSRTALLDKLQSADRSAFVPLDGFDGIRIDLGIQRFGIEFFDDTYPEEAGLDQHAINFNKGCYLGQEVVVKMRSRGQPPRKLVRLVADDAEPLAAGAELVSESGDVVGTVKSSSPSTMIPGKTVAFGSVRTASSAPDSRLHCGQRSLRIVALGGTLQR